MTSIESLFFVSFYVILVNYSHRYVCLPQIHHEAPQEPTCTIINRNRGIEIVKCDIGPQLVCFYALT